MMFSRDKDFEEALASPEALEKYLPKLLKQRRMHWMLANFSTAVGFFVVFCIIFGAFRKQESAPAVLVTVGLTMVFGVIQQTAAGLAAQADIRSLLVYKKLLERNGNRPS